MISCAIMPDSIDDSLGFQELPHAALGVSECKIHVSNLGLGHGGEASTQPYFACPIFITPIVAKEFLEALVGLVFTIIPMVAVGSYYFQSAGLILLVAMIGAIVLTLRHRGGVKRQNVAQQVARTPKTGMAVIKDVKVGEGVTL